jgi:hypothetical protein
MLFTTIVTSMLTHVLSDQVYVRERASRSINMQLNSPSDRIYNEMR